MKKVCRWFLVVILLTGCTTFGQMERGLTELQGENIQTAFNVLGYPTGKQVYGTDTVYYWTVNSSETLFLPHSTTTSGTVGTTPFYGTMFSTQAVPICYNCLIKIVADKYGTIKSWEYRGNIAGCEGYINRLNEYYKNKHQ